MGGSQTLAVFHLLTTLCVCVVCFSTYQPTIETCYRAAFP